MQPLVPSEFVTYAEPIGKEHQAIPADPTQ